MTYFFSGGTLRSATDDAASAREAMRKAAEQADIPPRHFNVALLHVHQAAQTNSCRSPASQRPPLARARLNIGRRCRAELQDRSRSLHAEAEGTLEARRRETGSRERLPDFSPVPPGGAWTRPATPGVAPAAAAPAFEAPTLIPARPILTDWALHQGSSRSDEELMESNCGSGFDSSKDEGRGRG